MTRQHLKRINAPKEWPIAKKITTFITRPLPGSHNIHQGMSINIILRDLLKYGKTSSEVKKILNKKDVMVDGKKVKEARKIVGLMDIISIPELKESHRIIIDKKGKLAIKKIDEKEATTKLVKVKSKKMEKGKLKLGTHDGRNITTDKKEINTGDTLIITIPKQEIKEIIKLDKDNTVYMIEGKYKGEIGKVDEIKNSKIITNVNGKKLAVNKKSIFMVGKDKPVIQI